MARARKGKHGAKKTATKKRETKKEVLRKVAGASSARGSRSARRRRNSSVAPLSQPQHFQGAVALAGAGLLPAMASVEEDGKLIQELRFQITFWQHGNEYERRQLAMVKPRQEFSRFASESTRQLEQQIEQRNHRISDLEKKLERAIENAGKPNHRRS